MLWTRYQTKIGKMLTALSKYLTREITGAAGTTPSN